MPTVTVVMRAFAALSHEIADALGARDIAMTVIAHPFGELGRDQVTEQARDALQDIMTRLRSVSADRPPVVTQNPERLLSFTGSWETINDRFYAEGFTDGLPIVPPTRSRVEQMVSACGEDADRVIGTIAPRMGIATVEKIAVNAVMAGCEDAYFPLVLAAVEAVCSPRFNLLPMQATTNPVTPLVIVNGPIARRLQINSAGDVFGQGTKSNATIGRALRFVLLNIGGGTPGKLDHACYGQPGKYSFCIAENEASSPWEPLHVERGFAHDDSTVSVIGVAGAQDIIHYARTRAEHILDTLVRAIPREGLKNLYSGGEPLLAFGPEQASILAAAGFAKRDVKRAFFERTQVMLASLNPDTIALLRGRRPVWFGDETPASIPLADSVDDVQVIVAGGAGNHTVFLPTWGDTRCVTVKVGMCAR